MSLAKVEVEVKIPLKEYMSFSEAQNRLIKLLGAPKEDIIQRDTYFESPVRNFWQTDEAIRLREVKYESDQRNAELTYKGAKIGDTLKIREEISVSISSTENMKAILKKLGFSSLVTLQKRRLNWEEEDLIISLDWVNHLRAFIEIEITIPDNKVNTETNKLILSKVHELLPEWKGEEERRSYLEMLITRG